MGSAELVLGFLEKENRPYNVGNIVDAMHGAVKKGEVQRCLDQLEERKLISVKEFGKNKVMRAGSITQGQSYRRTPINSNDWTFW